MHHCVFHFCVLIGLSYTVTMNFFCSGTLGAQFTAGTSCKLGPQMSFLTVQNSFGAHSEPLLMGGKGRQRKEKLKAWMATFCDLVQAYPSRETKYLLNMGVLQPSALLNLISWSFFIFVSYDSSHLPLMPRVDGLSRARMFSGGCSVAVCRQSW